MEFFFVLFYNCFEIAFVIFEMLENIKFHQIKFFNGVFVDFDTTRSDFFSFVKARDDQKS